MEHGLESIPAEAQIVTEGDKVTFVWVSEEEKAEEEATPDEVSDPPATVAVG